MEDTWRQHTRRSLNARTAVTWSAWQRREDYYPESVLLWLDVDARLRELSQNTVSIDQFAQRFFATHGSVESISTYSFQDVYDMLNTLAPADWKSFLKQHLFTHALPTPSPG